MGKNPLATIVPEESNALSLIQSGNYLRRAKLCAPLTAEVGDGQAEVGDYFLVGVENLGPNVDVVVVAKRSHALRLKDNSTKVDGESYDPKSELFLGIQSQRDGDWGMKEPNPMYGYDFLLYLPSLRTFCTIFHSKMALKLAARQFQAAIGKGLQVMSSRKEPSKKNPKIKFDVPTIQVAEDQSYDAPTQEELTAAVALFQNPRAQTQGEDADGPAAPTAPVKGPKAAKGGRKGR